MFMVFRTCCVCGEKGEFESYICPSCADKSHTASLSQSVSHDASHGASHGISPGASHDEENTKCDKATTSRFKAVCRECGRVLDIRTGGWKQPPAGFMPSEKLNRVRCSECWKAGMGHYKVVLHVVGGKDNTEVDNVVRNVLAEFRRAGKHARITKIEGHSYYLNHIGAARTIARRFAKSFGANVTQTAKMVGRDRMRSKDKFKVAIRVELWKKGSSFGKKAAADAVPEKIDGKKP